MRLHYLQHVPFENAGNIEAWAKKKGYNVSKTVLYYDEAFPEQDSFDWLIVTGGPMNVYEERDYPWLRREKAFIARAIEDNKQVLGIGLGAQLIADVMGGKVTANRFKEIGWHRVDMTPEARTSPVFRALPSQFIAFHWHGDAFSLPAGCTRTASTEACENQAFEHDDGRVVGLQFHLESTDDGINRLIKACGGDLTPGKYVQLKGQMLHQDDRLKEIYRLLSILLEGMEQASKR